MAIRFLRRPAVSEATGECRSRIYKKIAEGNFPPSIKLGPRSVAWPSDEIELYQRALRAGLSPAKAVEAVMQYRQEVTAEFATGQEAPR